jgi:hypothetical protein
MSEAAVSVTRDDVHRLVDDLPAEELPVVGAYLAEHAGPTSRGLEQRLADAGLLEELGPCTVTPPDPATVTAARERAGRGKPLSEYVSEGR